MKISGLTKAIGKFVSSKEKGKKLKAKKVSKLLEELENKQNKFAKAYAKESSAKAKKKLERKLKVVAAQIRKGRKLLNNLNS